MNRLAAVCAAVLALLPAACAAPPAEAPGPAVTALRKIANDALLATEIKAKLIALDPDSTASLGVHVDDGAARLTGTVRSYDVRARAVAAARSVAGVTAVTDDVKVDPAMQGIGERAADAALAARIGAALLAETGPTAVRVEVDRGVVTLRGRVTDPKLRSAALAAARNTSGVRRVVDRMEPPG